MGFTLQKQTNKKLINKIVKNEAKKRILKSIILNEFLPHELRDIARIKLDKFSRKHAVSRLIFRCLVTNKSRSVIKKERVTDIVLKKSLRQGLFPGFKKGKKK